MASMMLQSPEIYGLLIDSLGDLKNVKDLLAVD